MCSETETQDNNVNIIQPVGVHRTYKSRLFEMIFSEEEELLKLYNAINGTSYTDATLLEINTLENAIYMSMRNDLSFIIDSRLTLYEHQSTYSPNLPLRCLLYVADFLRKHRAEAKSVSIYEYDEEKHMRQVREEGREEGRMEGCEYGFLEGERNKLIQLIQKKLEKGKSIKTIAEELEESIDAIRELVEQTKQ